MGCILARYFFHIGFVQLASSRFDDDASAGNRSTGCASFLSTPEILTGSFGRSVSPGGLARTFNGHKRGLHCRSRRGCDPRQSRNGYRWCTQIQVRCGDEGVINLIILFIRYLSQLLVILVIVSVILSYFMDPYHPVRRSSDSVVEPML